MAERASPEGEVTLTFDPQHAVAHLGGVDQRLAELIKHAGPYRPRVLAGGGPFQVLLRSIVYQQLSGKAAGTIHARLLALFSGEVTASELLEKSEAALRSAGLSRAKVAAVRDLATRVLDGTVPETETLRELADEQIIKRLTAVRGVGRWTVEMLLLFYLGRPDVLPVHDLGVRKGYRITYCLEELPAPRELTRYAEIWRPYRSVASWYMWRAVELDD